MALRLVIVACRVEDAVHPREGGAQRLRPFLRQIVGQAAMRDLGGRTQAAKTFAAELHEMQLGSSLEPRTGTVPKPVVSSIRLTPG
ncbi:hypothetical protein LV780_20260 (plasmid) [Cereibacter azotoformans]|uniref:hypothetical protein n=1 Tax=Cereibacter azotoformans TaxID=43057 RepID=UPI001F3001B8|nr:hypothetical protein [Cereibacter azotoformans]UIJ32913.1 hypothetical protein LV780_20260 [Cereibacter azotoformans]